MVLQTASHKVSSRQTRDLECFADSSGFQSNPHTIRFPDQTAIAPHMSLLSLCALLVRQSHLFLICVVLTYNDSRIIHRKTCQNPRNCQCKGLLVSSSAPRTSSSSSGSLGKILICTGMIVSTVLPSLVPPRHIDDCSAIHFLYRELCDLQYSNHPNVPLLARLYQHVFCKKPFYFLLQADITIWVLRKVRIHTVRTRTRFHYCSRFHWKFMRFHWKCLDFLALGFPKALLKYFHQPNSLSEFL